MNSQIVQGKGNLLDIVREYDASLTGNYVRINGNDPNRLEIARGFMKPTKRYLLRSDATCEDGRGATFAGLFNSLHVTSENFEEIAERISTPHDLATLNPLKLQEYFTTLQRKREKSFQEFNEYLLSDEAKVSEGYYYGLDELKSKGREIVKLDKILSQMNFAPGINLIQNFEKILDSDINFFGNAKSIARYAEFRGVSMVDSRMDFILHERYDFNQLLMMEHPNYEGLMHVEVFFKDRAGYALSESLDFFIEDKDRFRKGTRIPGLEDIVTHYQELMKDPRVNQNYSYVMEAGVEPTRIVQLRPFLKKELVEIDKNEFRKDEEEEQQIVRILGNISEEGIIFEYDANTRSYPGLLFTRKKFNKEDLPYDVYKNQEIKVIIEGRCSNNQYLEHAGLLNLERVISYDNGYQSRGYLKEIFGAPKIRYYQRELGERVFEVVK